MNKEEQPIVCDLTVFPTAARKQIANAIPDLFKSAEKVQELPDGYALQFPNEPGMFMKLANFVEHERQCCPFLHLALEATPNSGPFWLRLTGGDGVKEFVQVVWNDIQGAVSAQLIQTGSEADLNEAAAQAAPVLATIMKGAEPFATGRG